MNVIAAELAGLPLQNGEGEKECENGSSIPGLTLEDWAWLGQRSAAVILGFVKEALAADLSKGQVSADTYDELERRLNAEGGKLLLGLSPDRQRATIESLGDIFLTSFDPAPSTKQREASTEAQDKSPCRYQTQGISSIHPANSSEGESEATIEQISALQNQASERIQQCYLQLSELLYQHRLALLREAGMMRTDFSPEFAALGEQTTHIILNSLATTVVASRGVLDAQEIWSRFLTIPAEVALSIIDPTREPWMPATLWKYIVDEVLRSTAESFSSIVPDDNTKRNKDVSEG